MEELLQRVFSYGKELSISYILTHGQLLSGRGRYSFTVDERIQEFDNIKKELIKEVWREHLICYPKDFNGLLLSVQRIDFSGEETRISLRPSDFATFFSTLCLRPTRIDLERTPLDDGTCLPISIGCITVTHPTKENPKGCLIFAERAETAFENHALTLLPGGYMETGDIGHDCLGSAIKREALEEIGISDIIFENLGLVYGGMSRQPMIVVKAITFNTKTEIIKKAKRTAEIKEIFFIDNDFESIRNSGLPFESLAIHDAWKLCLYLASQDVF
jgi:ADP-ribose pyrophosphatase YjhB (NUDIX family)